MLGEHLGTRVQPRATRARYPVHQPRKSGGEATGRRASQGSSMVQDTDLTMGQPPTSPDRLLHSGNLRTQTSTLVTGNREEMAHNQRDECRHRRFTYLSHRRSAPGSRLRSIATGQFGRVLPLG
jgi:hypothetical protein